MKYHPIASFSMVLFNQYLVLFCCMSYCLARLNEFDINCLNGPDYWCLNSTTENLCNITNTTIGICGYSSKRCVQKTGDSFCKSSPPSQQSPFEFNGGITGVDDNLFFYYALDLYWPPSNCPPIYNETADFLRYFCSPYTDINQPGSERLALHGLWPTFSTKGNYQGWPQFCSGGKNDWSKCHIDGNLCPWTNTTKADFSQTDYEYCLSVENIEQCLINATEILVPEVERLKVLAPGYLGKRNLFINHEWAKHGSCCSSIFQNNISNYLTYMLDLVQIVTQPGSLTYEYIQRNVGEKIGLNYLLNALNQTTTISCNEKCELEEIAICMNRDNQTGLPTHLIPCPLGAQNTSDSCRKARCEYVFIPQRNRSKENLPLFNNSIWLHLFIIIFVLILLKYLFILYKPKNNKN